MFYAKKMLNEEFIMIKTHNDTIFIFMTCSN